MVRVSTPSGQGSGFVVHSKEGYIVTDHHVVAKEQRIQVTFFIRKGSEYEKISKDKVRIVALNPFLDLALLKLEELGDLKLPQVYLAPDARDVKPGDPVFAIGNPLGFERSVSEGIVSKAEQGDRGHALHPDDRRDQPGELGRPTLQRARRGHRDHQHEGALRRRARVRDPARAAQGVLEAPRVVRLR